jgi:hypothetical protein
VFATPPYLVVRNGTARIQLSDHDVSRAAREVSGSIFFVLFCFCFFLFLFRPLQSNSAGAWGAAPWDVVEATPLMGASGGYWLPQ